MTLYAVLVRTWGEHRVEKVFLDMASARAYARQRNNGKVRLYRYVRKVEAEGIAE